MNKDSALVRALAHSNFSDDEKRTLSDYVLFAKHQWPRERFNTFRDNFYDYVKANRQ